MSGTPLPPGRCSPKDLERLSQLTKDKDVLVIGGYCSRSVVAIALVAKSVLVIEDFLEYYPVSSAECMGEFIRCCGAYDEKINLIQKPLEEVHEDQLGVYDVVYVDADYPGDVDGALTVAESLTGERGITVWHSPLLKGGIAFGSQSWLSVNDMPLVPLKI